MRGSSGLCIFCFYQRDADRRGFRGGDAAGEEFRSRDRVSKDLKRRRIPDGAAVPTGKIIRAMNILKERKLPFGISCCYTSANAEVIGSEAYFDQMIEMGAKFAWFFTYMPVGKAARAGADGDCGQREMMYHKIREYRIDIRIFWNDGEYVGGCIAGGRSYCHINANGDVEPCAFIHYSDSNIREKSLLEACRSPLFMGYHDNQPWNDNLLRPCPVLDNPGRLTEIAEKSHAQSTDYQNLESAKEFSDKCVETAAKWAPVAERLWNERQTGCASCGRCQK